jgi:hypothetical protein
VANTAVSSANVALVHSVVVGRFAVYSRHNSVHRIPPRGKSAWTGERPVYSRFNFHEKVSAMQIGLTIVAIVT